MFEPAQRALQLGFGYVRGAAAQLHQQPVDELELESRLARVVTR